MPRERVRVAGERAVMTEYWMPSSLLVCVACMLATSLSLDAKYFSAGGVLGQRGRRLRGRLGKLGRRRGRLRRRRHDLGMLCLDRLSLEQLELGELVGALCT